jgi:replication factor C subunit 1
MNLWFEKYRPKTLDDMVISDIKKSALIDWFTRFKEGQTNECAILFTGPPGLGKTSLAHILLKKFDYKAKEFNASDIRSKALVKEALNGLINISDVTTITRMNHNKIGIIMDEVDGMFKGDRGGIDELLSYISVPSNRKKKINKNANRRIPIICICNIGNVKKETIKNLQKECYEVAFNLPDMASMYKVIERILQGENMSVTNDAKVLVIDYAQGDFRRLIGILEFLYVTCGSNIDTTHVQWCYDILSKKEQDLHITDSIKKLINVKLDGHTIHTIYDADKSKAPMVVHQNYLQAISLQKTTHDKKIYNSIKCIDNLILSDVIEKTMYNTQCWFLQPIQGFTCAVIPNYYINVYPKTSALNAQWASVLSVSSQSQNLRKNMYMEIYNVDDSHSYSIDDVQTIIEIIFHHMINGDTQTAVKMMLDYRLTELNDGLSASRKKSLLIIDKIAKYIKISPYYSKWARFRDDWKCNKELDQEIKKYVLMYGKGIILDKDRDLDLNLDLDLDLDQDDQDQSCTKKTKPILKTKSKPKSNSNSKPKPKPNSKQGLDDRFSVISKPKLRPVIKSKQEQLELVKGRQIVTIKVKSPS